MSVNNKFVALRIYMDDGYFGLCYLFFIHLFVGLLPFPKSYVSVVVSVSRNARLKQLLLSICLGKD